MNKSDKRKKEKLLQRVTDIYSGAIGGLFCDTRHIIGPEELSTIVPAIFETFFVEERPVFLNQVGYWITNFDTPKNCTDFLWIFRQYLPEEFGDKK